MVDLMPFVAVQGCDKGGARALGIWWGTAETDDAGLFEVDYSAAGFIEEPIVTANVIVNEANPTLLEFLGGVRKADTKNAWGRFVRGDDLGGLTGGPTIRSGESKRAVRCVAIGPIG